MVMALELVQNPSTAEDKAEEELFDGFNPMLTPAWM
jgi:hypothetical protein